MKAAVLHGPKDLRIEERDLGPLGSGEVRIGVAAGGICGSDLHYYFHGGFGTVRLQEPMVLGHEVSGVVEAVGGGVEGVSTGDRVAVNPSRPCGACRFCLAGQPNHCLDMRLYGSAMRRPHVQGAFQEALIVDQAQVAKVPALLPLTQAAFAEPLSVGLHAVRRAGSLLGKTVLVTGQGPIGALAVAAAKVAGASRVIATDIVDAPLDKSREMGADEAINVAAAPEALEPLKTDKGQVDVLLEASGSEAALCQALELVRPGGVLVQMGLGGDMALPMNLLVAKELELRGTFRFHAEFHWAVDLIASGRIDVTPLLTEVVPLAEADRAFDLAADRSRAMKVQLGFSDAAFAN